VPRSKGIIIAPLNWGLGHATRCIPIIRILLRIGHRVILASDGIALDLLKKEFPQLPFYELPSYEITYRTNNMMWNMATQLPQIGLAINREKKKIAQIVEQEDAAIILSDNRYGCRSSKTKNIILTHQINIKAPAKWMEKSIALVNHRLIDLFDECWVPDYTTSPTLAGELSRNTIGEKVVFIGPLSRMKQSEQPLTHDIIVVLSGPEPQRSFLEKEILEQASQLPYRFLLIQGRPDVERREMLSANVEICSYMTSEELNSAILSSKVVLCRSGYSSIMDLVTLNKRAILVPTPGQTEQEYLAHHLNKKGNFVIQQQGSLAIKSSFEQLMSQTDNMLFDQKQQTDLEQILRIL